MIVNVTFVILWHSTFKTKKFKNIYLLKINDDKPIFIIFKENDRVFTKNNYIFQRK